MQTMVTRFLCPYGLFVECPLLKCHKQIVKPSIWQKYFWITSIANVRCGNDANIKTCSRHMT